MGLADTDAGYGEFVRGLEVSPQGGQGRPYFIGGRLRDIEQPQVLQSGEIDFKIIAACQIKGCLHDVEGESACWQENGDADFFFRTGHGHILGERIIFRLKSRQATVILFTVEDILNRFSVNSDGENIRQQRLDNSLILFTQEKSGQRSG